MEQALQDRGREPDVAWDVAEGPAEWVVRLPPVPADIAYVRVVDIGRRTSQASRAIK